MKEVQSVFTRRTPFSRSKKFAAAFIFVLGTLVHVSLPAQVTFRGLAGEQLTCYARHQVTGQVVPVLGVNGYANGFSAFATYQQGYPTIIFDTQRIAAQRQTAVVLRFLYYHECAHLAVPTSDEVIASCAGLRQMRTEGWVDASGEREIGAFHGALGQMPPQYCRSQFCTGAMHWSQSLSCAGRR